MLESIIELGLCLVLALACLIVVVWDVASGRIAYLDGITVAVLGLTLGAFFMFDIVWSWHSSELGALLKELRKGSSPGPDKPPSSSSDSTAPGR